MKLNTIYDNGENSQSGKRYVMFIKNEETLDIEGFYLKSRDDVNLPIAYISKTDRTKMTKREFDSIFTDVSKLLWFEDIKPYKVGLKEVRWGAGRKRK